MKRKILLLMTVVNIAKAKVYTSQNSHVDFENFKIKYGKNYDRLDEAHKYHNFIDHMNNLERMNTPAHINMHNFIYAPNKYIDLDEAEMNDQYAARIPYDQGRLGNPYLRAKPGILRSKDDSVFYNLHDADSLYSDFLRKFGKEYDELDKIKHYFRFVKTLVELNRNNARAPKSKLLTENADVIREPNKFFS